MPGITLTDARVRALRPRKTAPQCGNDPQIHPSRRRHGDGRRRDGRRRAGALNHGGQGTHAARGVHHLQREEGLVAQRQQDVRLDRAEGRFDHPTPPGHRRRACERPAWRYAALEHGKAVRPKIGAALASLRRKAEISGRGRVVPGQAASRGRRTLEIMTKNCVAATRPLWGRNHRTTCSSE